MPITPEVSKKLLELKEESGLSLEQIGQNVGTSGVNVARYIKGETKTPDRQLLYAIIRTIGGDPDVIFDRKKPEPFSPPIQSPGIDYAFYEKLEERRREEVSNLKSAYETTIQSKDKWIERIKSERDALEDSLLEVKREKRHLQIAVSILASLVILFILVYLIPDILRGDWGHIIYSSNP